LACREYKNDTQDTTPGVVVFVRKGPIESLKSIFFINRGSPECTVEENLTMKGFLSASVVALLFATLPAACNRGDQGTERDANSIVGFAYIANIGGTVSQYTIGADGTLTPMTPATVAASANKESDSSFSIAADPSGKYVYVATSVNFGLGGGVWQYRIGADGALTPMTPASVAVGPGPSSVTVAPSGKYVYVTNNINDVSQYTIGEDGALTPMNPPTVPARSNPHSITLDPSGRYAYVANSDKTVSQYTIGSDGVLTSMTPSVLAVSDGAFSVRVEPLGRYVYVTNGAGTRFDPASGSISQFLLGLDGALTPLTPAAVAAGSGPNSIAFDTAGKYVYITHFTQYFSGGLWQYTIGANGALAPMSPAMVSTGTQPNCVAVDPAGKFAYVGNSDGTISQYTIGADGALAPMTPATIATLNSAHSIVTVRSSP
jgi:DNA-binding beta-propeller fold protein YncE